MPFRGGVVQDTLYHSNKQTVKTSLCNCVEKKTDLVIRHYMEIVVMIQYFGSLCLVVLYLIQTTVNIAICPSFVVLHWTF